MLGRGTTFKTIVSESLTKCRWRKEVFLVANLREFDFKIFSSDDSLKKRGFDGLGMHLSPFIR